MPIIMEQFAVGTAPTGLFQLPPGTFSCAIHTGTANTVFIGQSTAVTTTNGYAVPTSPAAFQGFLTTRPGMVYGVATAATTINVILVTDQ